MSTPVDAVARHLATLLRVADLSGRLAPRDDEREVVRATLRVIRRATAADRASLFEVENASSDDEGDLAVTRIARVSARDDGVAELAPFSPRHVALLLGAIQGGTTAFGPIDPHEPFYAHHVGDEPHVPRFAALAPIVVGGRARGVLEVARAGDAAFSDEELASVEDGARTLAAARWGLQREATIAALLADLLPEVLDPSRAPTSLPERILAWLRARGASIEEGRAIALATAIAELADGSTASLELVQTVLAATKKAMLHDVGSWSEVARGAR